VRQPEFFEKHAQETANKVILQINTLTAQELPEKQAAHLAHVTEAVDGSLFMLR
jgi:hypothetical protein